MTDCAEDSGPEFYMEPGESYYGFTSSDSDEEETCMQNFYGERIICYASRSGTRYVTLDEAFVMTMYNLENNSSERIKRSRQSAATSTDEDSEEDEPNTRRLKLEKKLSSIKRAAKRRQTDESRSSKKKNDFKEKTDSDNSEEDEPNTRRLKPEKKLRSKKRAAKRRQTDESGSSKKETISRRTPIQTATSKTQRPSKQLSAELPIAEDNSDEAELNTGPFEKKLHRKKMGSKSRPTDATGSP